MWGVVDSAWILLTVRQLYNQTEQNIVGLIFMDLQLTVRTVKIGPLEDVPLHVSMKIEPAKFLQTAYMYSYMYPWKLNYVKLSHPMYPFQIQKYTQSEISYGTISDLLNTSPACCCMPELFNSPLAFHNPHSHTFASLFLGKYVGLVTITLPISSIPVYPDIDLLLYYIICAHESCI